jgi:hypothetical protein
MQGFGRESFREQFACRSILQARIVVGREIPVGVPARRAGDVDVEALELGPVFLLLAQVPLADERRAIASGLERLGERRLFRAPSAA